MIFGDVVEVTILRLAHGGVGVGSLAEDSRVCLVRGGLPGDVLRVRITRVKTAWLKGVILEVLRPSELRVEQRCAASRSGAGCCDFGMVLPAAELSMKASIVQDQLRRIAGLESVPECAEIPLEPNVEWRTRWRLGVDDQGRAGVREDGGNDVVWREQCAQAPIGLLDGIVGEGARRFTPGAEVVVALGTDGARTITEVRQVRRGRRRHRVERVLEGSELVYQEVLGVEYRLPATAFWQAHEAAPATYVELAASWLRDTLTGHSGTGIGWDLYGGVGLFIPALLDALSASASDTYAVHSVETFPTAARHGARALRESPVRFHRGDVADLVPQLPTPDAVILDPPRKGAGAEVVAAIAAARPRVVLHVGCDPATFARDCGSWYEHGYAMTRLAVINAFPGTHHSETFGLFKPVHLGYEGQKAALSGNDG